MWKKSCDGCGSEIEKKFGYCPYCGYSLKKQREEEDFGMLGRDDDVQEQDIAKAPGLLGGFGSMLGIDKMINSMVKQLDKEMAKAMNAENRPQGMPRGFRIEIRTGKPQMRAMPQAMPAGQFGEQLSGQPAKQPAKRFTLTKEELERRRALPRKEAQSQIKRLSNKILYEIDVPGVRSEKDVVIARLENSIEIKAYSKDKCYFKIIPLQAEIIASTLKDGKVVLELRS